MSDEKHGIDPTPNGQKKEDSVARFALFMFGIPLLLIIALTMATH